MECEEAISGEEALACLRTAVQHRHQYAVVLLDRCMQGKDGLEVAQQMAANAHLSQTKVVMLSSIGQRG